MSKQPVVPVGVVGEGPVTIDPVPPVPVGEVLLPYLHVVENKIGKLEEINMEVTLTDTKPASYSITYPLVVPPPPLEVSISCTPNNNPSAIHTYSGEVTFPFGSSSDLYISPRLDKQPARQEEKNVSSGDLPSQPHPQ